MISFHNPGLIDLTAATTLGVNVKEGESAIGRFGSGLKFSAACALRYGGRLILRRGDETIEFTSREELIRGKPFKLVYLGDQKLGFTTDLGPDWEPWMIFRELASNAKDEGGDYTLGPVEDDTVIELHGFDYLWSERGTIFLETVPRSRSAGVEIHDRPSKFVFYRGIRVAELPKPALFTYNIVDAPLILTEDRTVRYDHQLRAAIGYAIADLSDEGFSREALLAREEYYEAGLNFGDFILSDLFADYTYELSKTASGINESALKYARERRLSDPGNADRVQLSPRQKDMYSRVLEVLRRADFILQHDVIFIESIGATARGVAARGNIFVAQKAFDSTADLAETIVSLELTLRAREGAAFIEHLAIREFLRLAQEITGRSL